MYAIIAGGGTIGKTLANALTKEKNDVVIIEQDPELAKALANEVDALVIKGAATKQEVLKEAGLEKADAILAVTSDDTQNLMVCELAKKANIKRVVAKVNESSNLEIFVGIADAAIDVTSTTVSAFVNAVSISSKNILASIGGGRAQLLQLPISEKSKSSRKKISELGLPSESKIVNIDRSGQMIFPTEDMEILPGDIVYLIVTSSQAPKLTKIF